MVLRHYVRIGMEEPHYEDYVMPATRILQLFGYLAGEMTIRRDGNTALIAGYESVQFLVPVYAGESLEIIGEFVHVGNRSRKIKIEAYKTLELVEQRGKPRLVALNEPKLVATALSIVVLEKEER